MPSFGDRGAAAGADGPAPIPSYAPQDPAGLGFPTPVPADLPAADEPPSPGQWSDGSAAPPPGRPRRGHGDDELAGSHGDDAPRRLLPLLLLLVVLVGGGYLVWSQLLQSDSEDTSSAPPVRPSVRASATVPAPVRTLSAAELASSMADPHFKHGYDWGKQNGTVPAAQGEQVCRTEAFKERGAGYPWGAHDRAGCLIAVAGG
ncbi:MAG: hypothetical protein QOJ79_862 [Actinomycetota bacterium]|nr:hypothetical protein [Actinomycetota bacterium]